MLLKDLLIEHRNILCEARMDSVSKPEELRKEWNKTMTSIVNQLKSLQSELDKRGKRLLKGDIDWADLGSLQKINVDLKDITKFLGV